jgi:hypothetical protein
MTPKQYEVMLSLQATLRADATDLFNEYQKMHLEILGPRAEISFNGFQHTSMAEGDYQFDHADSVNDLPSLPYREEWDDTEDPTTFERMVKDGELHFKQYLGYESAYNTFRLPFAWLFNPAWKDEAKAKLEKRAEEVRNYNTFERQRQEALERQTLARLTAKYGTEK